MSWVKLPWPYSYKLGFRRYKLYGFSCEGGVWHPATHPATYTLNDIYIARPGGCAIAVVELSVPLKVDQRVPLKMMLVDMLHALSNATDQMVYPTLIMPVSDLDQAIVAAAMLQED